MNLSEELNWASSGNCSSVDPEAFFTDGKRYDNEEMLRRICGACTVQSECLKYSLNHAVVGWWGGTSERTRRTLRQRYGIIAKAVTSEAEGALA